MIKSNQHQTFTLRLFFFFEETDEKQLLFLASLGMGANLPSNHNALILGQFVFLLFSFI